MNDYDEYLRRTYQEYLDELRRQLIRPEADRKQD